MKIRVFVLISLFLLAMAVVFGMGTPQSVDETMKKANEKTDAGDRLKDEIDLAPALAAYLDGANLFEKVLSAKPGDRSALQNRQYCLGQRGYIQITRANKKFEEKKWSQASVLFDGAIKAYELALSKIPEDKGFKGNVQYARQHGGAASFQALLEYKGQAPNFSLPTFDNRRIELKNLKGKVVLLEFWTGWCPSCQETLPVLKKIQETFSGKPFQVLAVAMDQVEIWRKSGSDQKALASVQKLPFISIWGDEAIYFHYGAFKAVPTQVLIDANGNLVRLISQGESDFESLRKLIAPLFL